MLKSDQVLDPVIACSDYRYKKNKICKIQILFYFLEIHSKQGLFVNRKCFLVEIFHLALEVWLGLVCVSVARWTGQGTEQ